MKESLRGFILLMVFNLLIAGSMGCATMYTASTISSKGRTHDIPVLTDEIVAIGRPDPVLVRELGQKNVVAFLGMKNTYMLFKGGEELEQIAQGGLEGNRITLDTTHAQHLYLKDKQVWGDLLLTYSGTGKMSPQEQEELARLSFSPRTDGQNIFERSVSIEGVLYPAIKLSARQDALRIRRSFTLYSTQNTQPSTHYAAVALLPLAVAADIVLTPVYLGLGIIAITVAAISD